MSEMVEKVARAIASSLAAHVAMAGDLSNAAFDAAARAAIEAMRNPSMAMIEAAVAEHYADGEREFVAGWRVSITTALK